MAFPIAAGFTDMSSSSLSSYVPMLYGSWLEKFYAGTVYNEITNTQYEGQITKYGDEIKIRTVPDISIFDYVDGEELPVQTSLTSPTVSVTIDKGYLFNFPITDVQEVQSDLDLIDRFGLDGSEQMKIKIDTDYLAATYADAHASNKGTAAGLQSASFNMGTLTNPVQITRDSILNHIIDAGVVLDEQSVPEEGRFYVMPPWMCGMLKRSDLKEASLTGDPQSVLRNGRIGRVDRFTIYSNTHVNQTTDTVGGVSTKTWDTLFGHPSCLTFATQMTRMRLIESEHFFGKYLQSLVICGWKTTNSKGLGSAHVSM